MRHASRILAPLAAIALLLSVVPATFAAGGGPTRELIDLNDPQIDIDESAWASDLCGFEVDAEVSGFWNFMVFPDDRRMFEIDSYHTRATYTNVATGATVRLRDVGPDRGYIRDGVAYVGVTGRSVTGSFNIGVVVIDLSTGEAVFQAGRTDDFNARLCSEID